MSNVDFAEQFANKINERLQQVADEINKKIKVMELEKRFDNSTSPVVKLNNSNQVVVTDEQFKRYMYYNSLNNLTSGRKMRCITK